MPGTGTLTLSGTLVGLPSGQRTITVSIPLLAAIDVSMSISLTSGDNTIAIPANTTGVIIEPPPGNTVLLKMKGAAGDLGVNLHKTQMSNPNFDVSQSTIILNAASALLGPVELTFY